jgi:peroxiredoxin Q/BCP
MTMRTHKLVLAAVCALVLATPARSQVAVEDPGPKVGEMAPDFTLPAATKDGLSVKPIHLADLRGQVVVIAFFPRARTGG